MLRETNPAKLHKCAALSCKRRIPTRLLMCGRHWSMLSGKLQSDIWRTYRRGQELAGVAAASGEYLDGVTAAVIYVADQEAIPSLEYRVEWFYNGHKGQDCFPTEQAARAWRDQHLRIATSDVECRVPAGPWQPLDGQNT